MGISPSTKWTTKHYFNDPILEVLTNDIYLEPIAVVIYGSSDANNEKIFNSTRAASIVQAINPDGAILECEGWGNNHVDWMNAVDLVGKKHIPLVGVSYKGVNNFVVHSKYIDGKFIDTDKAHLDHESCNVGENSVDLNDAKAAIRNLKMSIIERANKYETK